MANLLATIVEKINPNYLFLLGITIVAGLVYRKGRIEFQNDNRRLSLVFSDTEYDSRITADHAGERYLKSIDQGGNNGEKLMKCDQE